MTDQKPTVGPQGGTGTPPTPSGFVDTGKDAPYVIPPPDAVEVKAGRLRAFFEPDVIAWLQPSGIALAAAYKPGQAVTVVPFVAHLAIRDRLDAVLGMPNWSETHENPGDFHRVTLSVRFAPGADWVDRVGVSDVKDGRDGYEEAFRSAALALGVGRYLLTQVQGVVWDGKALATPRLPDHALPTAFRSCGRERARVVFGLAESATVEARKHGFQGDASAVVSALLREHGAYHEKFPGGAPLWRVENRHADDMTRHLNDWITDIAAGRVYGPCCPRPLVPAEAKGGPPPTEKKNGKDAPQTAKSS